MASLTRDKNLYIHGLHEDITEEILKKLFGELAKYGGISSVKIMTEKNITTGQEGVET